MRLFLERFDHLDMSESFLYHIFYLLKYQYNLLVTILIQVGNTIFLYAIFYQLMICHSQLIFAYSITWNNFNIHINSSFYCSTLKFLIVADNYVQIMTQSLFLFMSITLKSCSAVSGSLCFSAVKLNRAMIL